jgi:hypothetical protein
MPEANGYGNRVKSVSGQIWYQLAQSVRLGENRLVANRTGIDLLTQIRRIDSPRTRRCLQGIVAQNFDSELLVPVEMFCTNPVVQVLLRFSQFWSSFALLSKLRILTQSLCSMGL